MQHLWQARVTLSPESWALPMVVLVDDEVVGVQDVRADGFAAKHNPLLAGYDGFIMGIGFGVVLVVLGALRELFGTGAVFANLDLLLGPIAADWQLTLVEDYKGFLLAILPPGAFIVLGLLIALKNRIDQQLAERATAAQPVATPAPSRRVRVTGAIE